MSGTPVIAGGHNAMNYIKRDPEIGEVLAVAPSNVSRDETTPWAISYRAVAPIAIISDALIILAMSMASGIGYHFATTGTMGDLAQFGGSAAAVSALFIALGKSRDLYTLSELLSFKKQVRQIAVQWILIFLFLTAVAFTIKMGGAFSRGATLSFAGAGLAGLILVRVLLRIVLADGLAVRKFSGRKVVLIAEETSAAETDLVKTMKRHGLQLANHFVLPAADKDVKHRKNVIARAISSIRGSDVEEVVISADLERWSELHSLFLEFRVLPIPVNLVPAGAMSDLFKLPLHSIGDTVTIELQRGPRTLMERCAKRLFDIVVAAIALMVLFPLFLFVTIAIKSDTPGPAIFRQRRTGFNGRQFQILKFRSMSVLEDGETIAQAKRNDARVTRIGNWLRRTSVDELPQLINVLQGTMSIVGPRPHAVAHDNQFDKLVGNYAYRHHVKPGLTGWAQIHGYRGSTRRVTDIEKRVELDLWYIDNWSFGLDFKIIMMTTIEIMRGDNAY